jgi:hypothetical protein
MAEEVPEDIPPEDLDKGFEDIDPNAFEEEVKQAQAEFDDSVESGYSQAVNAFKLKNRQTAAKLVEALTSSAPEESRISSEEAEKFFESLDKDVKSDQEIIDNAKNFYKEQPVIAKKFAALFRSLGEKTNAKLESEGIKVSEEAKQSGKNLEEELNKDSPNENTVNTEAELIKKEMEDIKRQLKEKSPGSSDAKWNALSRIVVTIICVGGIVGGAVGLYYLIKQAADDLTGCYRFTVSSSGDQNQEGPLACPDKNSMDKCSCFSGTSTAITSCSDDTNDYAPCCAGGAHILCEGTAGQPGSIYYSFQKVTPASMFNQAMQDLINLLKGFGGGISNLLKTLLIGGGIILIVGLVLFIVLKLIPKRK